MRLDARVDANQAEIVAALRKAGCTVQSLARVGAGCPDALVARAGLCYLLEIKTDGGTVSDSQVEWARNWASPVYVVRSVDEALRAVGLAKSVRAA
jgi:hypothetical protein